MQSCLNAYAAAWVPSAASVPLAEEDSAGKGLLDLPSEVVAGIISHLSSPEDVVACGLLCKGALALLKSSSLDLDLRKLATCTPISGLRVADQLLTNLKKYMPGVVKLDVSGLALEDQDVLDLLVHLPRLQHLQLGGCRKLTSRLASTLVQGNASQQASSGQAARVCVLQALNLQRCFQLRDTTANVLLKGAACDVVPLEALALSHLDLSRWPAIHQPPTLPPSSSPSSSTDASWAGWAAFDQLLATALELGSSKLQGTLPTTHITMLALNNCTGLNCMALAALTRLCPQLQYLILGGCTLQGFDTSRLNSISTTDQASTASRGMAELPEPMLHLMTQLRRDMTNLPAQTATSGLRQGGSCTSSSTEPVGRIAFKATPALTVMKDAPWMAEAATLFTAVALSLPHLKTLDLTFMPLALVARVAWALQGAGGAGAAAGRRVHVWDLTQAQSVQQALAALQLTSREAGSSSNSQAARQASSLRMVLCCAANCSNPARATPLHAAAERGDTSVLQGLLALGSRVDVKEKEGAAPLFLACEAGHLACVQTLLEAGAHPQLSNAAGERPLYIAALRGHLAVVNVLLAACNEQGLAWQDAQLYSDCWTPLMAAAVADRHDVAAALLQAAGRPGASILVGSVNRYGQSVLHIAARKASARLLRLLLSSVGSACCCVPDSNGDTPLDVARKHHNLRAVDELQRRLRPINVYG